MQLGALLPIIKIIGGQMVYIDYNRRKLSIATKIMSYE